MLVSFELCVRFHLRKSRSWPRREDWPLWNEGHWLQEQCPWLSGETGQLHKHGAQSQRVEEHGAESRPRTRVCPGHQPMLYFYDLVPGIISCGFIFHRENQKTKLRLSKTRIFFYLFSLRLQWMHLENSWRVCRLRTGAEERGGLLLSGL